MYFILHTSYFINYYLTEELQNIWNLFLNLSWILAAIYD